MPSLELLLMRQYATGINTNSMSRIDISRKRAYQQLNLVTKPGNNITYGLLCVSFNQVVFVASGGN